MFQVMKERGLPRRLGRKKTRQRPLLQALIAARVLAPLMYADKVPAADTDPLAPAEPSKSTRDKAATRRNSEGFPAFSFRGLLDKLQGVRRTTMRIMRGDTESPEPTKTTEPDETQKEALRLASVKL